MTTIYRKYVSNCGISSSYFVFPNSTHIDESAPSFVLVELTIFMQAIYFKITSPSTATVSKAGHRIIRHTAIIHFLYEYGTKMKKAHSSHLINYYTARKCIMWLIQFVNPKWRMKHWKQPWILDECSHQKRSEYIIVSFKCQLWETIWSSQSSQKNIVLQTYCITPEEQGQMSNLYINQ